MPTYRIAMIGCGKLGGPTADLMEEMGHDVRRYDIARDHGFSLSEAVKDRDLIMIAVPTPHDPKYGGSTPISDLPPKDFDYSALHSAVTDVCRIAPGTPVVIISTVLPGTTRRLFGDITTNEIIYNPYLISMGAVKKDLENPDIVIVGTTEGAKSSAVNDLILLHQGINGLGWLSGKIRLGTWEEWEVIKIFYNTFISAKLGLVNMIQDVAQRIGNMDVDVVTAALQLATQRITGPRYMTAGMGDGGPCHPRDNIALRWLANELDLGYDLFDAIMRSRELQARNIAALLAEKSAQSGLDIVIHGKSFKPGVPYCDGSYSLLVGHYVEELTGKAPRYVDPLSGDNESSIRAVILLAHDHSVSYNYSANGGQQYCEFLSGSIVVDPWRKYASADGSIEVIYYGNTRRRNS